MNSDRKRKLASYLLLTGTAASGVINGAASNTSSALLESLFSKNKSEDKASDSNANQPWYKSVFTLKNVLLLTVSLPLIVVGLVGIGIKTAFSVIKEKVVGSKDKSIRNEEKNETFFMGNTEGFGKVRKNDLGDGHFTLLCARDNDKVTLVHKVPNELNNHLNAIKNVKDITELYATNHKSDKNTGQYILTCVTKNGEAKVLVYYNLGDLLKHIDENLKDVGEVAESVLWKFEYDSENNGGYKLSVDNSASMSTFSHTRKFLNVENGEVYNDFVSMINKGAALPVEKNDKPELNDDNDFNDDDNKKNDNLHRFEVNLEENKKAQFEIDYHCILDGLEEHVNAIKNKASWEGLSNSKDNKLVLTCKMEDGTVEVLTFGGVTNLMNDGVEKLKDLEKNKLKVENYVIWDLKRQGGQENTTANWELYLNWQGLSAFLDDYGKRKLMLAKDRMGNIKLEKLIDEDNKKSEIKNYARQKNLSFEEAEKELEKRKNNSNDWVRKCELINRTRGRIYQVSPEDSLKVREMTEEEKARFDAAVEAHFKAKAKATEERQDNKIYINEIGEVHSYTENFAEHALGEDSGHVQNKLRRTPSKSEHTENFKELKEQKGEEEEEEEALKPVNNSKPVWSEKIKDLVICAYQSFFVRCLLRPSSIIHFDEHSKARFYAKTKNSTKLEEQKREEEEEEEEEEALKPVNNSKLDENGKQMCNALVIYNSKPHGTESRN